MSDLYETDTVLWAEQQAELLRRRAAGELVNEAEIDWANVAEEIEDVGRSERETVISLLTNILDHKLRLLGWPDDPAARHWEAEVRAWLARAARRHRPSMHIENEMADMFQTAGLDLAVHMVDAGPPSVTLPTACPWTLDELLAEGEAARRWRPD
jgi:Domain of unknown function DUF29